MLSDSGPPFGAQGIGGPSRLSVWLLKLDVQPVFIGSATRGERVGIKPVGEWGWHLYLGPMQLGLLLAESDLVLPLAEETEELSGVTHVPG